MIRDGYGDYVSPLTARSTIASIDAGMIVQAVEQMSGTELERVENAVRERRHKLTTGGLAALGKELLG